MREVILYLVSSCSGYPHKVQSHVAIYHVWLITIFIHRLLKPVKHHPNAVPSQDTMTWP
jgi:hypothetical protein